MMPTKLLAVLTTGLLLFFVGGMLYGVTQPRPITSLSPGLGAVAVVPAAPQLQVPGAPVVPAAPPAQAVAKPAGEAAAGAAAKPAALPRLPQPQLAAPITRTEPATLTLTLETRELKATMADGVTYTYWTFDGTVPGPLLRVRQGDTVEVVLKNAADSAVAHSIDFHAVTGPGGGAKATQTLPGQATSFTWRALNPGVYVYHCATPVVANHVANGMYGLIVVEPPQGLAKVDREYYVVQGDFYLQGKRGENGHRAFSLDKMLDENPDFVVFNGSQGSLTGEHALKAKVGETVRIFFGVGGPNMTSSFHVIGEIFDRVYPEGASEAQTNIQTTMVPAGGATIVEFKVDVPGRYILVDHSLGRLEKGGAGYLEVEGPANPEIFRAPETPAGADKKDGH